MEVSTDEKFLHDWVVRMLVDKYSRIYSQVSINPGEQKNHEFNGYFPDAIFINLGQVVQIIEVETKNTVNEERVSYWKEVSDLGAQLVVLAPKESQKELRDLCWNNGLSAKVKIGSFDVDISF